MHKTGIALVAALVVGLVPAAAYAQKPDGKTDGKTDKKAETDEQQLIQIERGFCASAIKPDAAFLERVLHDDYTGIYGDGSQWTKASEIADAKNANPDIKITGCTDDNLKVRIYGDAAVVTASGLRSGTMKDGPFKDRKILYTDTFIKKDGRWQCVASQLTRVIEPKKK